MFIGTLADIDWFDNPYIQIIVYEIDEDFAPKPSEKIKLVKCREEEIKKYHTENQIQVKIRELRKEMETVAKKLDFLKAADLRDKIEYLKKKIK